jgi:hypothetical protein
MKIARILLVGMVVASFSGCNVIPAVVPGAGILPAKIGFSGNDAAFRKRVEADPFPAKGEGGS